mmetsp:Transcript_143161/g.398972  ORF Transcript_143161/g.398972 Transcript_143161/m.398972 type:complete len:209 (+) Transcript_143161:3079-3705(+)
MASARSTIMLPGLVGTSKTSASSSNGRSSRVPLMGPKQKMTISLCRMKVVIHVEASSKPNSGGSSVAMPVSCTRPGVLTGQEKPRAPSKYWSMTFAVSVMASSSFERPMGASWESESGISMPMIRADPSPPRSPSTIISAGRLSLPCSSASSISLKAFWKSASAKPGSITQNPLVCKQAAISMLTPDRSAPAKAMSYSWIILRVELEV